MKKILFSIMLCAVLLILSASFISACEDGDEGCKNSIEKTEIRGFITDTTNDDALVPKASVTVTCSHDGTDYTKTTKSIKKGYLKGWYSVVFSQSQCEDGDVVTVTATKGDLTGKVEGTVEDFKEGKCWDLDLARIDIPLVPEFGVIAGLVTALGSLGMFFVVRRK